MLHKSSGTGIAITGLGIDDVTNLFTESVATPFPVYVKLWASVLRRAAVDWVLYKNHKSPKLAKIGMSADNWIFRGNHSEFEVGSFETVCDFISMDPKFVRNKIQGLSEDQARRLRGMEFGEE